MKNSEVGRRWADRFLQLNINQDLVNKTGMCNTITHCYNEYMVSVKNYLVYGLRDQYLRLMKKLKVKDYKMVGLKVLENFVEECKSNFSFKLSTDDMTFLRIHEHLTEDLKGKIDAEKKLMPKIMSYNSAFAFLSRVRDRFDVIEDETKQFYVAPLSSMTPTFIRLNKVGLQHSMAVFRVRLPNLTKPKEPEGITDIIEWHP